MRRVEEEINVGVVAGGRKRDGGRGGANRASALVWRGIGGTVGE